MFFRLFLRNRYFRRILSKKLYFYKKFFQIKPNEDVNQKAFTNLSLTWEKQMDFLRLCETSNTLQLPVFLFFCQSCPGVWNWESVFLILKISQYGSAFSISQGIHVRFDIRIDISISIRPKITKFGNRYIYRIWLEWD